MNRMIRLEDSLERRGSSMPRLPLSGGWSDGSHRRRRGRRRLVAIVVVLVVVVGVGGLVLVRRGSGIDAQYVSGTAGAAGGPAVPTMSVPVSVAPSVPGFVSTLRGLVDGAVSVMANGEPLALEPGGSFTMMIPQATTSIQLVATAADGDTSSAEVAVTADVAPVAYPPTAALHVRGIEWADPAVRQSVLDLAAAGRINAVELDIKDESGLIGYSSAVPMASTLRANAAYYDAADAVAQLHGAGVRVIGRIVCFLDPLLANWAWSQGRGDLVVLDGAGNAPLSNNYGNAAFTNPASAEVRQYQIDVAVEAAGLGFDDILYDYVRRPEGDLTGMQFPGLTTAPDVAIARFVSDTASALGDQATLGLSVFGISASRPEPTGQDIRLLAPLVDYIAPMVYPSHWGPGEYGVADPLRQPADIVARSVADFARLASGSGAAVVPWLEDFSAGSVTYGPAEVRAQIDAARANGADGFLLWNPHSTYSTDGLDPPAG